VHYQHSIVKAYVQHAKRQITMSTTPYANIIRFHRRANYAYHRALSAPLAFSAVVPWHKLPARNSRLTSLSQSLSRAATRCHAARLGRKNGYSVVVLLLMMITMMMTMIKLY